MVPYALIHDGLLMPLFGCMILGLAGENPLAFLFGLRPLVFVGEASYCLYLFALYFMESDSQFACAGAAGAQPVRSVDQLRAADRHGAAGALPGGEAGAAAIAQEDGRVGAPPTRKLITGSRGLRIAQRGFRG